MTTPELIQCKTELYEIFKDFCRAQTSKCSECKYGNSSFACFNLFLTDKLCNMQAERDKLRDKLQRIKDTITNET